MIPTRIVLLIPRRESLLNLHVIRVFGTFLLLLGSAILDGNTGDHTLQFTSGGAALVSRWHDARLIRLNRRPCCGFLPEQVTSLERRAVPSGSTRPRRREPPLSVHRHSRPIHRPCLSPGPKFKMCVSDTVSGQTELLDVYTPTTPAPAGGYPVMLAIHGGGWHFSDKSTIRPADGQGLHANMATWWSHPITCCLLRAIRPGR